MIAFELHYIPDTLWLELKSEVEEIEKMLNGYIAFLKKSKQGANEPGANHAVRDDSVSYATDVLEDLPGIEEAAL